MVNNPKIRFKKDKSFIGINRREVDTKINIAIWPITNSQMKNVFLETSQDSIHIFLFLLFLS